MNCKDFQIILLQDPLCEEKDFTAHAQQCGDCAYRREQAREFEAILRSAMAVPPEKKIQLAKSAVSSTRWRKKLLIRALPVLLLLGIAVFGINLVQQKPVANDLPRLVTSHIEKEPELLESQVVLSQMTLKQVLSPMKFELSDLPGDVTAAVPCWIRQGRGMHLVVRGEQGPVTVLLMPGEFVQDRQTVMLTSLSGVIVPTQWGSMAVLSHAGEDVSAVTSSLQHTLRWKGIASGVAF